MNKIELEQAQNGSRRQKRIVHKNLIAFLQIVENIGPITVVKDDLDMLKDDQLFCTIELMENSESGAESERKTVYRNHIQKKLEEFSGSAGNDDYQLDGEKDTSSSTNIDVYFSNFLFSITTALILVFF